MKLSLIAVCILAFIGCASGESDPFEELPAVTVIHKIPATPAPPAPPAPPSSYVPVVDTDAGTPIKCVIDDYWVGTCYVVKIYCEGKPIQVEMSCSPSPLWPWEIIPNPPFDYHE